MPFWTLGKPWTVGLQAASLAKDVPICIWHLHPSHSRAWLCQTLAAILFRWYVSLTAWQLSARRRWLAQSTSKSLNSKLLLQSYLFLCKSPVLRKKDASLGATSILEWRCLSRSQFKSLSRVEANLLHGNNGRFILALCLLHAWAWTCASGQHDASLEAIPRRDRLDLRLEATRCVTRGFTHGWQGALKDILFRGSIRSQTRWPIVMAVFAAHIDTAPKPTPLTIANGFWQGYGAKVEYRFWCILHAGLRDTCLRGEH